MVTPTSNKRLLSVTLPPRFPYVAGLLGLNAMSTYTQVQCRLTGWHGWVPFPPRFVPVRDGVPRYCGNMVTVVLIHPCHLASATWLVHELFAQIDKAAYGVSASTARALPPPEAGKLIWMWMTSDYQLTPIDLGRLAKSRRTDKDLRVAFRYIRHRLWEMYEAQRVTITKMPRTNELYVGVVDMTPWVPPTKKTSHLDKE